MNKNWEKWLHNNYFFLLFTCILLNASGLFIPIIEPDGALYATIAKTMAQTNDFIQLKMEGKDWLDKPHFPFWITAISYKIFGFNTFAYKLPAFLFWLMGALYTYRFSKLLFHKSLAQIAVLIYCTAAHLIISNNDVRAEPYLTGLIITSVYYFYKANNKKISYEIVLGSFFTALAIMTKGPFVLLTIFSGFFIWWIYNGKWTEFLKLKWLLCIALICLFILPEIYCLYYQFDLHPEKIIFNKYNVSGVRFFFWDSQFGRFFNTGPIKGEGDLFFYLHTTIWAFLPWSILFFIASFLLLKSLKNKTNNNNIIIVLGNALITFIVFSLSKFQLPHYINILFPFFSIITAWFVYNLNGKSKVFKFSFISSIIVYCLSVVSIFILIFLFHSQYLWLSVLFVLTISIIFLRLNSQKILPSILLNGILTSIVIFGYLNLFFYPTLLQFQTGNQAASFINNINSSEKVALLDEDSYSFTFYINKPYQYLDSTAVNNFKEELIIFTKKENLKKINKHVTILKNLNHFRITQLNGNFINYKTRLLTTSEYVVAKLSSP